MPTETPTRRLPLPLIASILTVVVGAIAVTGVVLSILAYSHAVSASSEAVQATHEIKQSRRSSIMTSCREQNDRNSKTIKRVNLIFGVQARALSGGARAQSEQTRKFTILLVEALAPVKDCKQRATQLTKP